MHACKGKGTNKRTNQLSSPLPDLERLRMSLKVLATSARFLSKLTPFFSPIGLPDADLDRAGQVLLRTCKMGRRAWFQSKVAPRVWGAYKKTKRPDLNKEMVKGEKRRVRMGAANTSTFIDNNP